MIVPLGLVSSADKPRVGSKAFNCARLKQAGFPVPDGVAVPSDAVDSPVALAELDAWLARLPTNARLAVRSSATDEDSAGHSFAGIHETHLNRRREQVAEALRACCASVRSPRALAYRRALGLATDSVGAGVLVQRMVEPVVSGVAFTLNPVTGARDELVINAAWGLGEALVSGQLEPDEFRVRKSGGALLSKRVGEKRVQAVPAPDGTRWIETDAAERARASLSEEQVRELVGLLLGVERDFGAPLDVEWCHDGRQFWILQSRPVTTIPRTQTEIEWTRANVREVLPDLPSPQTVSLCIDSLNRGFQQYYGHLLAPEAELGPIARAFFGRVYFNLSQLRRICELARTAPAFMMRSMGHPDRIRAADELAPRPPLGPLLRALPDVLRMLWAQVVLPRTFRRRLARMRQGAAELNAAVPQAQRLSEEGIYSLMIRQREEMDQNLQMVLALGSVALHEHNLDRICRSVGFPYEKLVLPHLAAGEKSVSAQQGYDLLALSRQAQQEAPARDYFLRHTPSFEHYREELGGTDFLRQFGAFLEKYGHRGKSESDWALPRYREDPSPLLRAVQAHVEAADCPDPEEIQARLEAEAAQAWQAFERQLRLWQRLVLLPVVRWLLARIKRQYAWRELFRSEMTRVVFALRFWHLALAERLVTRGWLEQRDDYFYLTFEEVEAALRGTLLGPEIRALVARRKGERAFWEHLEMPLLMRESELPALIRRANALLPGSAVTVLAGYCVSPGCAEGEVVVLRQPDEVARMKRGAILVAPATDPGWTPLFTLAAGVIVEVGGRLSHAATVAREYGLPALANVKDATKLLKSGDLVELDATNGFVRILGH